jgi:hypothetical protein
MGSYTPRLMRLLISDTKSPRVKKTIQTTFVIKSRVMGLILGVCLILPTPPGIVVYQDHYRGHYKKIKPLIK